MKKIKYDTGYRITSETPKYKIQAIIESECECPICRNKTDVEINTVSAENEKNMKNTYRCPVCGTTWEGNIYDKDYNMVKKSRFNKNTVLTIICTVFYLVICAVTGSGVFNKLTLMAINFVAFGIFALAGLFSTGNTRKKNNHIARTIMAGLAVQILTI